MRIMIDCDFDGFVSKVGVEKRSIGEDYLPSSDEGMPLFARKCECGSYIANEVQLQPRQRARLTTGILEKYFGNGEKLMIIHH